MKTNAIALSLTLLLAAACAHAPLNQPVARPLDPTTGYRFGVVNDEGREDETFVIVTMSGGGTRAAALAYGVLLKLAATKVDGGKKDLLSTVDVVSSVSGGSFTAAYYALHGREGLPKFKSIFLDQNIEGGLIKAALNPLNWPKLLSPYYSRTDLAADYYDKHIFEGATYAQMPKTGPFTILNATEMDIGSQFTFTQEQFDGICSDLSQLHVARAATASSAFPGALSPITFKTYTSGGGCGYQPGTWFTQATNDYYTNPKRYKFRSDLAALIDPNRPWLHFMDGGVADNIGLRNSEHAVSSLETLQMNDTHPVFGYSVLRLINLKKVKRLVVIVVNAKTENDLRNDLKEKTPNLISTISAASNTPLANYSFDTVQLMNMEVEGINTEAKAAEAAGVTDLPKVDAYFIQVAFGAISDPAVRKQFNDMGTNFGLPAAEVEKLIAIGPKLLDENPSFQRLLQDWK